MSITYSDAPVERPDLRGQGVDARVHVPAYARHRHRSDKRVKTWMILAPLGAAVLIGAGVLMVTGERPASGGLVEPAPALDATPVAPLAQPMTDIATGMLALEASPPVQNVESETAIQPIVPAGASTQRTTPASAAPVSPPAEAVTVTEPTGPRPYAAEPGASAPTATLNAAVSPVTPARQPAIAPRPLD